MHDVPNSHMPLSTQSDGFEMREQVAWHMPRVVLHMQRLFRSQVDWDVYANWHFFVHVVLPLISSHSLSAKQASFESF